MEEVKPVVIEIFECGNRNKCMSKANLGNFGRSGIRRENQNKWLLNQTSSERVKFSNETLMGKTKHVIFNKMHLKSEKEQKPQHLLGALFYQDWYARRKTTASSLEYSYTSKNIRTSV